jgi:hypothetical protein
VAAFPLAPGGVADPGTDARASLSWLTGLARPPESSRKVPENT